MGRTVTPHPIICEGCAAPWAKSTLEAIKAGWQIVRFRWLCPVCKP